MISSVATLFTKTYKINQLTSLRLDELIFIRVTLALLMDDVHCIYLLLFLLLGDDDYMICWKQRSCK